MSRTYELAFPVHRDNWWTANDRLHHHAVAKRKRHLRALAAWTVAQARPPRFERARVIAHVSYPTNTRADPGNVVGTVVKALIDGMTDAGCFPDDDHTHLVGPDPRRGPKTGKTGMWWVRLEVHELTNNDETTE